MSPKERMAKLMADPSLRTILTPKRDLYVNDKGVIETGTMAQQVQKERTKN